MPLSTIRLLTLKWLSAWALKRIGTYSNYRSGRLWIRGRMDDIWWALHVCPWMVQTAWTTASHPRLSWAVFACYISGPLDAKYLWIEEDCVDLSNQGREVIDIHYTIFCPRASEFQSLGECTIRGEGQNKYFSMDNYFVNILAISA